MAKNDLISRSALMEILQERWRRIVDKNGEYDHYAAGFDDAISYVDDAPAVDAVPVVHAKWVKDGERNTYCSHCEKYIPTVHFYEEYQDYECEWDEEIYETEYCPNCGAKMDGGADNG